MEGSTAEEEPKRRKFRSYGNDGTYEQMKSIFIVFVH